MCGLRRVSAGFSRLSGGSCRGWIACAWVVLWAALATIHVTQSIWGSQLKCYPGDALDGRFNNLVLEHGFQTFRGAVSWLSPAQYYPEPRTLGMSDTHVGTLPIYSLARTMGASVERAFQVWFVVVAALNAWAAARVLSAIRTPAALAGPLLFVGVGSSVMVWVAGSHMQMLPLFPGMLALEQVLRFVQDNRKPHIVAAAGWLGWQFAASPYAGFFLGICGSIGVSMGFAFSLAAPIASRTEFPLQTALRNGAIAWCSAGVVALAGISLCAAAGIAHLAVLKSGYGRPMSELVEHAPHLSSWFSAPPVHSWYPAGEPAGGRVSVEQVWFAGFWPWICLTGALAIGWRRRTTREGRIALTLALAAIGGYLFFTAWRTDSAFTMLARNVEELRAFRASGRSAVVLHLIQVFGAAAALTGIWLRSTTLWSRCVLGAFAVLGCIETIARDQHSTSVATMQARAKAVVEAWRGANDRPILLFAPGYTNQSEQLCHLDAWAAAMQLRRTTVNGYSGDVPPTHVTFVLSPTVDAGRTLISSVRIPEDHVSLVES